MRRGGPPLQLAPARSMAEVYESRVWVEHPELGFAPGRILRDSPHEPEVVVEAIDGTQCRVPRGTCPYIHPNSLLGVPDLLELGEFSLAALLHNVRVRYEKGEYYSSIGLPILISVNPYKPLPHLYDAATRRRYQSAQFLLLSPPSTHRTPKSPGGPQASASASPRSPLLFADNPHLFGTAQMTYSSLMRNNQAQSIVVSGESGAGKTEATKILLRYFSELDDSNSLTSSSAALQTPKGSMVAPFAFASRIRSSAGSSASPYSPLALSKSPRSVTGTAPHEQISVELHALRSNPILEAFGNAKTLRNDNSSRFGKFIQIFFDLKHRKRIRKAKISHYLLEKCRLVSLHPQERNYHVFYALIYGGRASYYDKLSQWELLDETPFHRMLGDEQLDVSETEVFEELVSCMLSVGFEQEEIDQIFELIAGLLHLSTLDFEVAQSSAANYNPEVPLTKPADMRVVERCARLFGICKSPPYALRAGAPPRSPLESFLDIFLWGRVRDATGGGSVISTKRDQNGARYLRDAIIKEAYSRLFEWLVRKINLTLCSKEEAERRAPRKPGTRIMESLRETPGMRAAGGGMNRDFTVGSSPPIGLLDIYGFEVFEGRNSFEQLCINYANEKLQQHFNHHVLSLEQKTYREEGIEWNDIAFADNKHIIDGLENKLDGVFSLLDSATLAPQADETWFLRELETSRHRDVIHLPSLKSSRRRSMVIRHYAGDVEYTVEAFVEKNKDKLSHEVAYYFGLCSGSPLVTTLFPPMNPQFSTRTNSLKATVSLEFRTQLSGLLMSLTATTPTYVRCIKPNSLKQPHMFDSIDVLRQLKYAGLLESIRIRNSGFGVRCTFEEFLDKYAFIDPVTRTTWRKARVGLTLGDKARLCGRILEGILPQGDGGDHSDNPVSMITSGGSRSLRSSSPPQVRAWQTGQTRVFMKEEVQIHLEKCRTQVMSDNAIRIQACWRGRLLRRWYRRSKLSICRLQRCWRNRLMLKRIHIMSRNNGAYIKLRQWLRWMLLRHRLLRARRAATLIQSIWRGHMVRRQMREMREDEGDESGLADEDLLEHPMMEADDRRQETLNGGISKLASTTARHSKSRSPRYREDISLSPREDRSRSRGISLEDSSLASLARHRHRSVDRRRRRNTLTEGKLRRLDTGTHNKSRRERNPELDLFNRERENQRTISALKAKNEGLTATLRDAQEQLDRKRQEIERLQSEVAREAEMADRLARMNEEARGTNAILLKRMRRARHTFLELAQVLDQLYGITDQDYWRQAASICTETAKFVRTVRGHGARVREKLYEMDQVFEEFCIQAGATPGSRGFPAVAEDLSNGYYSDALLYDAYGHPVAYDPQPTYMTEYYDSGMGPQAMYPSPQVGWNSTTIRAPSGMYASVPQMEVVPDCYGYPRSQRSFHRHTMSQSGRGAYDPPAGPSDNEYIGHVMSQSCRRQPDLQSSAASSSRLCHHPGPEMAHRAYGTSTTRYGQYPVEQGVILTENGRFSVPTRGYPHGGLPRSSSRGSREDVTPNQHHERVLSCNVPVDPARGFYKEPQASSDEAPAAYRRLYQVNLAKPPKSARQTPTHRVSNSLRLPRYEDTTQSGSQTARLPPSARNSRKSLQTSPNRNPQPPVVVQPMKTGSPFHVLDGKVLGGEASATSSTVSHTKRCIQKGNHQQAVLSSVPTPIDEIWCRQPRRLETSSEPPSSDSSNSEGHC